MMRGFDLLIADVDGTLVTPAKALTARTIDAVRGLERAGVAFAITSGRPPRGMKMLVEPLGITTPIAAFNGGMFVDPELAPVAWLPLSADVTAQVIRLLEGHGLDVWVYRGSDWLVRDPGSPRVRHERGTVHFAPIAVPSFERVLDGAVKIVGTSEDHAAVTRCEADARARFGDHVSASRSQPYFLDVTHPDANKGMVVRRLSKLLGVPMDRIATIGDMPNDVLMFALSGLGIAMGNASPDVQRAARRVTTSNEEEGFANAVSRYILDDEQRLPQGAAA
jgi:Cof subfamily protein (haloacid dehalogenase superfamily)